MTFRSFLQQFICGLALLSLCHSANAALFEDGDARRQILILTDQMKAAQKAILELSTTNDRLTQENAQMRGQLEDLKRESDEQSTNLKSYYQELNNRLKNLEPQDLEVEGVRGTSQPGEKQAYDEALKEFQEGSLSKADKLLSGFVSKYPSSPYWPLAQFWLANTKYASKDYKGGISTVNALIKRYPDHPRVPSAMLTLGNCQLESGQKSDAKKTFESIVKKYPSTDAAQTAQKFVSSIR